MTTGSHPSLDELIVAYLAGDIAEPWLHELAQRLLDDPDARRRFTELTRQEWVIRRILSQKSISVLAPAAAPRLAWRVFRALAAAAAVLALIGSAVVLLNRPAPAPAEFFTVVHRTGAVSVNGSNVVTDARSFCRLLCRDGTIIALDQNTQLDVLPDRQTGRPLAEHRRGRAYFESIPKTAPLRVRSGDLAMETLGTRFVVAEHGKRQVQVLDGTVKIICGESGVFAQTGQTVVPVKDTSTGLRSILVVGTSWTRSDLEWLGSAGMDADGILAALPQVVLPTNDLGRGRYYVVGGLWRVFRDETGHLAVRREDRDGPGSLDLGSALWKRGTLSLRARVLDSKEPVTLGLSFSNQDMNARMFGFSRLLDHVIGKTHAGWLRIRAKFEIDDTKDVFLPECRIWREDTPSDVKGFDNWRLQGGGLAGTMSSCGIGVQAVNCSAEFRDITLSDAVLAQAPVLGGRVAQGLIADYVFAGGKGTRIPNSAPRGAPLDLEIGRPDAVEWTPEGLFIKDTATIKSKDLSAAIREQCSRTEELSMEMWMRFPVGLSTGDAPICYLTMQTVGGYLSWYRKRVELAECGALMHIVCVYTKQGDTTRGRFYTNGICDREQDLGPLLRLIKQGPVDLALFGEPEGVGIEKVTTLTQARLLRMAVYNRALTETEVRRNFTAGPE